MGLVSGGVNSELRLNLQLLIGPRGVTMLGPARPSGARPSRACRPVKCHGLDCAVPRLAQPSMTHGHELGCAGP